MRIKTGIAVAIIMVLGLGLLGYSIFTQTQVKAYLDEGPGKSSANSPGGAGTAEDANESDISVSDAGENEEPSRADASDAQEEDGIITASATFNGRIDTNFIELEMEDGTIRSFQLSGAQRESFDDYGFEPEDRVRISYREREEQNPLIERIEELE